MISFLSFTQNSELEFSRKIKIERDFDHLLLVRFPNLETREDKELLKLIYNNPYKTSKFND